MSVALNYPIPLVGLTVGKERNQRGRPPVGKQFGVRLPDGLLADLEFIGETTGNDVSSVIRTILTENVGQYVRKANEVRDERAERTKGKGKNSKEG